ncbi:hypothetical protein Lal_00012428, partial [Lupinus albus]
LFTVDIILVGELRDKLKKKVEMWRQILEANDFRISKVSKTEYMECKFRKRQTNSTIEVKIGDHTIQKSLHLSILGQSYNTDSSRVDKMVGYIMCNMMDGLRPKGAEIGAKRWKSALAMQGLIE